MEQVLILAFFKWWSIFFSITGHVVDGHPTFSRQIYVCTKGLENTNYNQWTNLVKYKVIPGFFVLSLIFLGLLIIHILRTHLSTLFGWLILSAIFMLFVFYFFTCLIKMVTTPKELKWGCEVSGLIIQYSYISYVLWLCSMSFFLWKNFRKVTPPDITGHQYAWGCQHPNFKWYCMFSLGLPLIITIVTIFLQHSSNILREDYIKPGISDGDCFFSGQLPTFLYFHVIHTSAMVIYLHFSHWN